MQKANRSISGQDQLSLAMEAGLGWESPSAAATLLNAMGLTTTLWSSAVENFLDYPTLSNSAAGDYHPQKDVINNSMESGVEQRMVDENGALANAFLYNTRTSFSMNNTRNQEEELRLPPKACCLNRASVIQEQAFDPGLLTSADHPLNCLISSTNSTMNASVEDDGISSQIQIIEPENSMISSNMKNSWTVSWSGVGGGSTGAISSDSTEQDEAASQSPSHQSKNRKSPEGFNYSFSLGGESHICLDTLGSDFPAEGSGFKLNSGNPLKQKKPRSEKPEKSSNIKFLNPNSPFMEPDTETIAAMKEMIYRAAALRPVTIGMDAIEKPKRKNVRISTDPQTVAARQRRERISDRIRILQRLVPGGTKMDTATMLDEAANYLKFLQSQVSELQSLGSTTNSIKNHR